ncbi:MAG TPA: AraC family transcriptional regulator, partial [Ruminococcaceae bacterium]|nr:AraC family transcriptional regulator [Oscillospiraceae bacterium]
MPDSIFKHSFKATLRENMGLSVYNCGYQKCEPLYSWGPAVRDHYLIHYIASGSGRLHCGGHEYSLKEGDGFITAPLQMIYYQADAIEPWEYYWVGFNGADATRLINTAGLTDRQVFQIEKKDVILNALKKIYDSGGTRAVDDMRMTGYLYLFFSKLIGNLDEGNVGSANGYDYIQTALRYIEYNYSMDISVNDISKSVGISRSHLYRLFVKY